MNKNWFIEDGVLRAYNLQDFICGIKDLYDSGLAIKDPFTVNKAGSTYSVSVTEDEKEAERGKYLTWKALANHLQPLKSKNKLRMWADNIWGTSLNDNDSILLMKQQVLNKAFPEAPENYFWRPEEPEKEEDKENGEE